MTDYPTVTRPLAFPNRKVRPVNRRGSIWEHLGNVSIVQNVIRAIVWGQSIIFFSPSDERPSTAAVTATTQQERQVRSSGAPSIINADLTVSGDLTSTGDIRIEGCVEGTVRCVVLDIGTKGFIRGDIIAQNVTVSGRVSGTIRARKILLTSKCHVEGTMLQETFALEPGAYFEGYCHHSDIPLADDVGSQSGDLRPYQRHNLSWTSEGNALNTARTSGMFSKC